jgi:transcriptional regulator with XRE-family HTH domain
LTTVSPTPFGFDVFRPNPVGGTFPLVGLSFRLREFGGFRWREGGGLGELQKAFAADLDQLRRDAGLSAGELARRSRMSSSSVGDLLRGEWVKAPPWDRVVILVRQCLDVAPPVPGDLPEETQRLRDLAWWRAQHADLVRRLGQPARTRADVSISRAGHGRRTTAGQPASASIRQLPTPSGLFVGRSAELARLTAALASSGRVAIAAVHGLGGVGKSTLAARFAEVNADRYALVWWIAADTPGAVQAGLADLAMAVHPDAAALTPQQRVESAVQWLSTRQDWLLVLDNLPAPAAADDLLARVRTGTIMITSRQATGWRGLTTLSLDVLPPDEAEQLLTRTLRADWPDADTSGAALLCAELGWLPLAVEQAGAYMGQPTSHPPPTSTCSPSTPRRCSPRPGKARTPGAPSPGSGASHSTASRTHPSPGTCCAGWPGMPPTTSPEGWWRVWAPNRTC